MPWTCFLMNECVIRTQMCVLSLVRIGFCYIVAEYLLFIRNTGTSETNEQWFVNISFPIFNLLAKRVLC